MAEPILTLRDLRVNFHTLDGEVEAVKGLNLSVNAGETLAIVGESGSGKSQAMMAAMGLLASNGSATGVADYRGTNLIGLPKARSEPHPGTEDHHDLSGADDLARPAVPGGRPVDRADPPAPEPRATRRRGRGRWKCWGWCAFPIRNGRCGPIRTNCRAGSGSG